MIKTMKRMNTVNMMNMNTVVIGGQTWCTTSGGFGSVAFQLEISPSGDESESGQADKSYLDLDLHSNESESEDHQNSVNSGGK